MPADGARLRVDHQVDIVVVVVILFGKALSIARVHSRQPGVRDSLAICTFTGYTIVQLLRAVLTISSHAPPDSGQRLL